MSQQNNEKDKSINVYDLLYKEQNRVIIIGLTGRTGSGCSTTAEILKTKNFGDLDLPLPKTKEFNNKEERQYEVIYNFMSKPTVWKPFIVIEISSIIFAYMLKEGTYNLITYLSNLKNYFSNHITISELEKVKESIFHE